MVKLTWEGKYKADGKRTPSLRLQLPFQTVEMVNESAQERQMALDLFSAGSTGPSTTPLVLWHLSWTTSTGPRDLCSFGPKTKGKGLRTGSFGELGTPPRFFRRTFYPPSAAVVGGEAGRWALCPEPAEGAFACAEATVGYNWERCIIVVKLEEVGHEMV